MSDSGAPKRKRLSDILRGNQQQEIEKLWNETEAAADLGPLPRGEYLAEVHSIEATEAQTGTPGVTLTFRIIEGEYKGRRIWHTVWITKNALKFAKRDLAKLGIREFAQADQPLKARIICKLDLVLKTDDKDRKKNEVRNFDVKRLEPLQTDPFAEEPPVDKGDAWEPPGRAGDEMFPPEGDDNMGPYREGLLTCTQRCYTASESSGR